ncbi:hypothetical protein [Pseudomonas nunensis]|uniref:Ig-like domain-containing protein n=1 Tax=Pseudomonas nunensis TaxID=2961896 RepID=A0ABY5EM40_9PSED|nr:hypothetical protein [Pseudomonas nunensis]KPN90460.1 hypothetical protein AL066_08985 [Pseudomonas nunensis]MCL5225535.1 hypothetical protein [Pseudomonas nunensis]UTO16709.1 hypothetical protein NK667_10275 [Pseudomonas nunensis]
MSTVAKRILTPRTVKHADDSFVGTLGGLPYRANFRSLFEALYPDPLGMTWVVRVHQRAADFTTKQVNIYIPATLRDGEHNLPGTSSVRVEYVDYSIPEQPVSYRNTAGTINFTLDKETRLITGSISATLESSQPRNRASLELEINNFQVTG